MAISSLPHAENPSASVFRTPSAGDWMIHEPITSRQYERVLRMHLDAFTGSPLTRCILHDLAYPAIPRVSPDSPMVKGTISQGLLADRYSVSVSTIKRSMKLLTDGGFIRTRQRRIRRGYNGPETLWDYHIYKVPEMNPDFVKRQHLAD